MEQNYNSLVKYCEQENFKGWDPYDGLNSPIIQKTIFGKSRFIRLAWIQLFKRNPFNLRPFVGIKKEYNPKGLALFLIGYHKRYKKTADKKDLEKIIFLADLLLKKKSNGYSGACWGYNFDWQARAFFQPKKTPTIVPTSYAAEALLLAYDSTKNKAYLEAAMSVKDFVLNDLNRTYDDKGDYSISYSPLDNTTVYNAGLLAAKILTLLYSYSKNEELFENAKKITQYVVNKQSPDGSWVYSPLHHHQWIDNFHTGFNLECIYLYMKVFEDKSMYPAYKKGLDYYMNNFFTEKGESKFFNDKLYPIDVHAPAQLLAFLVKSNEIENYQDLAEKVINWTIANMQSKKGFFYYPKRKYYTNKTPYIRWVQAWMFYGLSFLIYPDLNDKQYN